MAESTMTLEEFEKFAETLPAGADKTKVARSLGLTLPKVIEPLDEQLSKVTVVEHTPKATKRNENPKAAKYVSVPSLSLDQTSGTHNFWVNTRVARKVAERILAVCDENDL